MQFNTGRRGNADSVVQDIFMKEIIKGYANKKANTKKKK